VTPAQRCIRVRITRAYAFDSSHGIFRLRNGGCTSITGHEQAQRSCGECYDVCHVPMRRAEERRGFEPLYEPHGLHCGFDARAAAGVRLKTCATATLRISKSMVEEGSVEDHLHLSVVQTEHQLRSVTRVRRLKRKRRGGGTS